MKHHQVNWMIAAMSDSTSKGRDHARRSTSPSAPTTPANTAMANAAVYQTGARSRIAASAAFSSPSNGTTPTYDRYCHMPKRFQSSASAATTRNQVGARVPIVSLLVNVMAECMMRSTDRILLERYEY